VLVTLRYVALAVMSIAVMTRRHGAPSNCVGGAESAAVNVARYVESLEDIERFTRRFEVKNARMSSFVIPFSSDFFFCFPNVFRST
jgi:hypothetical protein